MDREFIDIINVLVVATTSQEFEEASAAESIFCMWANQNNIDFNSDDIQTEQKCS